MKALPIELLQTLHEVPGFDEQAFMAAHSLPAVTSVRPHPIKPHPSVTGTPISWSSGVYLPERPVFTLDPTYHGGGYYVQEASSTFLEYVFKQLFPKPSGLRALDLCAAPGGKSTLIASLLDKDSLLVSNEVIRTRASILEENITRWGYMNTWVTSNDPRDFSKLNGYFDAVVVDAPCSGSGLFRKDARALDEWSEANVALCAQRQQRILADVWPALKEDGYLIYATCSYSPQEDEAIIDWLAGEHDMASVAFNIPGQWGIVQAVSKKGMTGYRFFPDKLKGEGFFISVLQKKECTSSVQLPKIKPVNDQKLKQQAGYLLKTNDISIVEKDKEQFVAISPPHVPDLALLRKALYMRKIGTDLGSPTAKEWLPAHDIALSIDVSEQLSYISVNKEQALRFLKKEDPGLPQLEKGWYVIRYEGLGLGWIKSIGNRINNYLPKHWRIRMEIPDAEWN